MQVPRPRLILLAVLVLSLVPTATAGRSPDQPLFEIGLSRRTAERLGLSVGDVIEVSADPSMAQSRRARVTMVWSPPEHPADVARGDLVIRFHLPDLQSLLQQPDTVDRIVVRLLDPTRASWLRDDLNALGRGYDAYTAADLARITSRTFRVITQFHRAIALITLLASGIFLITIMALKFTEMRKEIGALRIVGIAKETIAFTVLGIAAGAAIAGTAVGLALGAVLAWGINAYYQPLFHTHLRFAVITPQALWIVAALAVLLGLAAGAVVSVRLLRQHPLEQVGR